MRPSCVAERVLVPDGCVVVCAGLEGDHGLDVVWRSASECRPGLGLARLTRGMASGLLCVRLASLSDV